MYGLRTLALLAAAIAPSLVAAAPTPQSLETRDGSWWMAGIQHRGKSAFGDSSFQIFRNVKDFGAKGDGSSDDTAAINAAITAGNRCGKGCDSTTVTPAIVYFPPGTYAVSKPLIQYYFTQFVGDAVNPPTLKATAAFAGMGLIDSDPYDGPDNWYTNQNNFYRQVRNFVIDLTATTAATGIHWQVAQATTLQNIVFNMKKGSQQQGLFMDNGSGGWMSDLTFNGGKVGAFFGAQQFTTRNLVFNDCETAVYMNWNWLWTLKSLSVNNCGTGVDMTGGDSNSQRVGSVVLQDSKFVNTPIAVKTSWVPNPNFSNGTLVIDNVDFSGSKSAVAGPTGAQILAGGSKVASWAQGHAVGQAVNGVQQAAKKPAVLLGPDGRVFERSRPQYEQTPASKIVSVKAKGAKGDGVSDDTAAIQAVFDGAAADEVVFFDHGSYVVTDTVRVPKNIKITGEIWPYIMASGPAFKDQASPKAVFQVGKPGDVGAVEMSDLIFGTKGAAPGAILVEWNVGASSQGASGMWDVHWRIGGSAGSMLQSNTCTKNPKATNAVNPSCIGAFMLLHVTKQASIYMENNWGWVADHELDMSDHNQIDIFNGRGVLIESTGAVWGYGTAFEHSQLYNYQIVNAKNVYLAAIQTETPYYQDNPTALIPFVPNKAYADPTFEKCTTNACKKAWGLRIAGGEDIFVYGGGLYSFFENYSLDCIASATCQENIVEVKGAKNVQLYAITTVGTTNMLVDDKVLATAKGNQDTQGSTIAFYKTD